MYKLLIAEDEAILREGVGEEFEETGAFEVDLAENGEVALECARKKDYDVIIVDINMPKMDGLELLRHLNEDKNTAIRIIMSGFSDFEYAQKGIEYGVIDYAVKPLSPSKVDEIAHKLIERLDEKMEAEAQKRRLKVQADSSKSVRLDMLFSRMINGGYSGKNTEEKLAEMDIVIPHGNISVILVSPVGESERPDVEGLLFRPSSDSAAIVVNMDEEEVRKYAEKIDEQLDYDAIVAVSDSHDGEERLAEAYNEAEETLKYMRLLENTGVERYVDVKNRGSNIFIDELEFQVQLGLLNREELYLWVDRILDEMPAKASLQDYYSFAVYIAILCRNIVLKLTGGERIIPVDPGEILSLSKLGEIKEWLHKSIDDACEKISGSTWKRSVAEVEKTKEYIDGNLSGVITMADLAKNVYLSPNYLGKLFQEKVGMSISEYINRRRIEKACELLRGDNCLKIYEIAESVGINDANYFSALFKKTVGISPKEYKKLTG